MLSLAVYVKGFESRILLYNIKYLKLYSETEIMYSVLVDSLRTVCTLDVLYIMLPD